MTDGRITQNDFLHCDGRLIKNAVNQTVYLRGTNLGGWLLQEEWMAALDGAGSQWTIERILKSRFGEQKARELISRFQDNFITAYDLDMLKNAGFTCLRVPFWYGNLYPDSGGMTGSADFSRLDYIIEECTARGMYVILDMHGVPGHQSIAHHSCRENFCRLYERTAEGEKFRSLAVKLWSEIAGHYKNNPTVAAYDLMNEPMCDYHGFQKTNGDYHRVYDMLYKAVREKDAEHIITLEAIWTPLDMPYPKKYGWKNIMYQYHLYLPNDAAYKGFVLLEKARHFNIPVLIGEFATCRGKAKWENTLRTFNAANYNWCTWTYKGYSRWGEKSDWFITGTNGEENRIKLSSASYEEIYEAWGEKLRTEISSVPMNSVGLLGKYAGENIQRR